MEEHEKICRLCLKACENSFTVVEENATEFLIFLLESNLSVNKGALICANCTKNIKDCSNLKSTCLDVEDFILQCINHKDSNAKLDLKQANYIPEDHDVCRLCMGSLRVYSLISLDSKAGDIMLEKIMLEKCLPELDLHITKKLVICVPCRESLQHYFGFITNCLVVEGKIKKYCEAAGIDGTGLIKLRDVLEFTAKQVFIKDEIKVEDKFFGDEEHMDEEKCSKELQCTSENCSKELQCTSENVFTKKSVQEVKVKIEETLLEEINCKIEVKSENLRKMEEQQCENGDHQKHLNRFEVGIVSSQPVVTTRLHSNQERLKPNFEEDLSSKPPIKETLTNRKVTVTIMYKCDFCPYQANNKSVLKRHLLNHKNSTEVKAYKCNFCSYQTVYKDWFNNHMLFHKDPSEVTMYKCDFCLFQSRNKNYIKIHILKHKDPSRLGMYNCNFCLYRTKIKNFLKTHVLKHNNPSGIEMSKCDSCVYQTKCKCAFKRHLLKHKNSAEVPMYKCDFCLFQTRHKNYIKIHLLTHKEPSEVTMYNCDSCSFQTKRKNYIKIHILKHKVPSEKTNVQK